MDEAEFDEKDIEEEIERQLSALKSSQSTDEEPADDITPHEEVQSSEERLVVALPQSKPLKDLQKKLSSTRRTFERQLEECSSLLHSAEGESGDALALVEWLFVLQS